MTGPRLKMIWRALGMDFDTVRKSDLETWQMWHMEPGALCVVWVDEDDAGCQRKNEEPPLQN